MKMSRKIRKLHEAQVAYSVANDKQTSEASKAVSAKEKSSEPAHASSR